MNRITIHANGDIEASKPLNAKASEFSIYSLHDPRTKVIHYVGITEQPLEVRYFQHFSAMDNAHKYDWIYELHELGLKPIMRRLAFFEGTRAEAECAECAWMDLVEAKFGAVLLNKRRRASAPEKRRARRAP